MPRRTPEEELKQFKDEFQAASENKDREALEQMIHDNFTLVDPTGAIVSKEELIDEIVHKRSNFMDNFERVEHATHFHLGNKAARETAHVTIKGRLSGRVITGKYVNVISFVKGPDGWQMVGNTLTKRR
jgi:hypothetical protein